MKIELQDFLFHESPNRLQLFHYEPVQPKTKKIQVFRNHSFELVEHTIGAYLDYAGLGVEFSYSDYDDSLSFAQIDPHADLFLVWLDATRYKVADLSSFLSDRLTNLQSKSAQPILVIPFGAQVSLSLTGVYVWDMAEVSAALGEQMEDRRALSVTGTPLSAKALLEISRHLGLKYIPALLCPPIKAVLVDLDNTLYQGILGEDGPQGLELTPGHKALQERLKELADAGIFLCAVSKNDLRDVEELFALREDFPLKKEDFAKLYISWEEKAISVQNIASFLNIFPDSMLFLDDNIGELTALHMSYPDMHLICAKENAEETLQALTEHPGLYRFGTPGKEGALRTRDVQANEERQAMRQAMSQEDYIRSLELKLVFDYKNPAQIQRISELANKTNQFIFNYKRYTLAEVERMMNDSAYLILTVSLSDKLSDSGLIGVCVGHDLGTHVELEECFMSCRALGRGIDDVIVLGAIQSICDWFSQPRVRVLFQEGPRNTPAKQFVEQYLPGFLDEAAPLTFVPPQELLTIEKHK